MQDEAANRTGPAMAASKSKSRKPAIKKPMKAREFLDTWTNSTHTEFCIAVKDSRVTKPTTKKTPASKIKTELLQEDNMLIATRCIGTSDDEEEDEEV